MYIIFDLLIALRCILSANCCCCSTSQLFTVSKDGAVFVWHWVPYDETTIKTEDTEDVMAASAATAGAHSTFAVTTITFHLCNFHIHLGATL
jgi:hypothetical protein